MRGRLRTVFVTPRTLTNGVCGGEIAPASAIQRVPSVPAPDAAQRNGHDKQQASKEILGEDWSADHGKPIVSNGDRQYADQSAQDMELPLLERGGSEERRRERRKHEAVARCDLTRSEVGRHEHASNGGAGARASERDNSTAVDRNTCPSSGLGADAYGLDMLSLDGPIQKDPEHEQQGRHDHHEVRHAPPEPANGDIGKLARVGKL